VKRVVAVQSSRGFQLRSATRKLGAHPTRFRLMKVCISLCRDISKRHVSHLEGAATMFGVPQLKGASTMFGCVDRCEILAIVRSPISRRMARQLKAEHQRPYAMALSGICSDTMATAVFGGAARAASFNLFLAPNQWCVRDSRPYRKAFRPEGNMFGRVHRCEILAFQQLNPGGLALCRYTSKQ
jgi:hypothetical protein